MLSSRVIFHDTGMMDTEAWNAIAGTLSCVDHTRRPHAGSVDDDPFGALNVILFGDMKQSADRPKYDRRSRRSIACCVFFDFMRFLSVCWLPPATSKAPFIVVPWVVQRFEFRVLRQNRRIISSTEDRRDDWRWNE